MERLTDTLASTLYSMGIRVSVVTQTKDDRQEIKRPFMVFRKPTLTSLLDVFSKCDIVIMNGFSYTAWLLAKLKNRKIVWYHHDYDLSSPNRQHPKFQVRSAFSNERTKPLPRRILLGLLFLLSRLIARLDRSILHIFVSHYLAETQRGIMRDKLHTVIYNPVPTEFMVSRPRIVNEYDFLMYGRLNYAKGTHVYLEALNILRRRGFIFRAVMLGPAHPEVLARIVEAEHIGLVTYLGVLSTQKLIDLLDKTLVLVVPSIWEEPYGMVATEGMARGMVVVASNVGGLGEIVRGRGILFQPGDSESLADRLEWIATHREAAMKMATGSQQSIKINFDPAIFVRGILETVLR